jgi:hypothetical protein
MGLRWYCHRGDHRDHRRRGSHDAAQACETRTRAGESVVICLGSANPGTTGGSMSEPLCHFFACADQLESE